MEALVAILTRVSKKTYTPQECTWLQDTDCVFVPEGDEEGLLHEILHWIVASDEEREWPNLALDSNTDCINADLPADEQLRFWNPTTPKARERQTCYLTRKVFKARGLPTPAHSSCSAFKRVTPKDIAWAEERLAASGTSIEELAAALVTGQCNFYP